MQRNDAQGKSDESFPDIDIIARLHLAMSALEIVIYSVVGAKLLPKVYDSNRTRMFTVREWVGRYIHFAPIVNDALSAEWQRSNSGRRTGGYYHNQYEELVKQRWELPSNLPAQTAIKVSFCLLVSTRTSYLEYKTKWHVVSGQKKKFGRLACNLVRNSGVYTFPIP